MSPCIGVLVAVRANEFISGMNRPAVFARNSDATVLLVLAPSQRSQRPSLPLFLACQRACLSTNVLIRIRAIHSCTSSGDRLAIYEIDPSSVGFVQILIRDQTKILTLRCRYK